MLCSSNFLLSNSTSILPLGPFSKIELQFYFIQKCSKSAHKSHLVCRVTFYSFQPVCSSFEWVSKFKPAELNPTRVDFTSSKNPQAILSSSSYFCESGKIIPMPKFFVHPFLFSPLLSLLFCIWKRFKGGRKRERSPTKNSGRPICAWRPSRTPCP